MTTDTAPSRRPAVGPSATVDPSQIVGPQEIAKLLNVARSTVTSWTIRAESVGFPDPLVRLAMGPVYDMAVVRHWHRNYMQSNPTRGRRIHPHGPGRGGPRVRLTQDQIQEFVAQRAAARDS